MRLGAVVVVVVLVLPLAGCGGDDGDRGQGRAVVSAASSLKSAFGSLPGIRASFAGSDALAAQIRRGVRPDVFAAANEKLPAALAREGLVEAPAVFATNELVLAVPSSDARVRSLADVERDGVTIAVGAKDVPVGDLTRTVLARLGRRSLQATTANVRSEEPDVGGVVGKIAQGAVDAGFVYRTDVRAAGGRLREIRLPARLRPSTALAVAVVRGAPHPEAARRFVASLRRGAGRAALRRAGFGLP